VGEIVMTFKNLSQYDLVIFDCDGVLIDSNLLKCEAFGMSVSEYPDNIVEDFVNHCKNTFGVSRYIKFKEFFNFAREPYDEIKYHLFLERYARFCKELYCKANLTPGVRRVLSRLKNFGYKLFVASGNNEKELIEVFEKRKLNKYFIKIYGSPKKKTDCVSEILKNNPGIKAVFIGDTLSDLNVSKEFKLDFIYMCKYTVQSKEHDDVCRKEAKIVINTLVDLL
jgi:phosphoglycolate phosphatase-like HAD superfamily hydrolase